MFNSSYKPSYLHSTKVSLNNNNKKFYRNNNNGPVKLIDYQINDLINDNNENQGFKENEMKEEKESFYINSKNFDDLNKDHFKKEIKRLFNRNLNSNNTNILTNDDSRSFNFNNNLIEENSINISIYEKKREKERSKTTREINGLNYQDLVDIINRRKLLAEKMKIEKEKNNEINNNYIQDFIEKNDNGVQTSLDYNDEEEDIPQEYPFKQLQRNKSESHAIIKNNNNNEVIGELFSSLSSINISSNFKNNTFSNRKTKENDLEFNVIVNNNDIENKNLNNYKENDKCNNNKLNKCNNEKKENKLYDMTNNKNDKKDFINSSELDLVNIENDESKINNINNVNETDFKIENNDDKNNESEFKINENTVGLNIENNLDIQKEIFNQFPNPSFISVTTKDDFKIESNLDSIINTDEQEKSSVIESIVNQPSKSLISTTQKNEIEETQLEEYDQDKYRMQNETKEINMSSYMNSLYIKNKENDIKNNIDEKKKINYFEETLDQKKKLKIK